MDKKKPGNRIQIILPAGARKPTQDDIKAAKQYILDRSDAADEAQYVAGVSIQEAAEKLVEIAYRYDIPVSRFAFDSEVNEDMMGEVSEVMDDLEESLMEDVQDAALSCTKDNNRYIAMLAILLSLGHRNMSLRDTVHAYLWRTLRQAEALIASMKASNLTKTEARTKIKTAIQHVNVNSEFQTALKHPLDFAAPYIRNGGKATFPDGTPNVQGVPVNGYDAIKTIFGIAVAQIWMRNQLMDMQEDKTCIGYWQDRGSDFPCQMCEDEVGFHSLDEGAADEPPLIHPSCCCWRMPIYRQDSMLNDDEFVTKTRMVDQTETTNSNNKTAISELDKRRRKEIKELAIKLTEQTFFNEKFGKELRISKTGIREWLNQPHKHYAEKNELLLRMSELISNSNYLGGMPDVHNASFTAQIFETKVAGEPSWIIAREFNDGKILIHSITDGVEIVNALRRYKKSV